MHKLTKLQQEAHQLRMTPEEKAAMRAQIFGLSGQGAPSTVHVTRSPYVFASPVWVRAFAAVLLVVFVGGGTASAAQGSLPGDLLYPVKVSINEKVESALAPDIAAKAEVQAKLAERRVEEAEALASQGRLDTEKAEMIGTEFEAHAKVAEELAESIDADEPGTTIKVTTALATALQVHSEVLGKLGRQSTNESTKQNSATLATRVIARAGSSGPGSANVRALAATAPRAKATSQENQTSEAKTMTLGVTADAGAEMVDQKTAASLQKKAAESLADTKRLFGEVKGQLDATTTAQVIEKLAAAAESMSRGSTLATTAYGEASAHFTEVLRISSRLFALLEAERKYDNGLLKELLNNVQITTPAATVGPSHESEVEIESEHGEIKI
jgi:hypothetical protein